MKIQYDNEVDALSIIFSDSTVTTQHIAEGIAVDYDSEGHIAGIEILDAISRLGNKQTFSNVELEQVGLSTVL
jgi:uncharacterized protein YuzE